MRKLILFVAVSMMVLSAQAQITREARKVEFIRHVETLADDLMEGREAGTPGEIMAANYIAEEFRKAELDSLNQSDGYFQKFTFLAGREPSSLGTKFSIDKEKIYSYEFFPLPWSGSGRVTGELVYVGYGISAPKLMYDDYKGLNDLEGKIFLMEYGSPDGKMVHSQYDEFLPYAKRVKLAKEMGAAAVVFINHDGLAEPLKRLPRKISEAEIPVVYMRDVMERYPTKVCRKLTGTPATLWVTMQDVRKDARNVVGFVDNGQDYTVVIGAHYDHLGWGDEGSLHRGDKAIHNGADDNASGVAMIIELAKALKDEGAAPPQQYNYCIVAFSGEEKGLLGSNYFVKHSPVNLKEINYMFNFDMIGRLDLEKPSLGINGTGTTPTWEGAIKEVHRKTSFDDFKYKTTESGVGPSDHTSFYLMDIPVLHFFTGTHEDYHKPTDDPVYINYDGMEEIYEFIYAMLEDFGPRSKLEFTATKNVDNKSAPRFVVTLGVVPDYMFEGKGMRIDGITPDKPADNAGLKKGDVVTKLGEVEVSDMMTYMEALSKLGPGVKTEVVVKRGERVLTRKVEFK